MRIKWLIVLDMLFYAPIPFFIWFGQKELAIYCAEGGAFCILGTLLLYAMGIREVPLNPFDIPKVILEQRGYKGKGDPKKGILVIIITLALIILLIILDIPHPFYP